MQKQKKELIKQNWSNGDMSVHVRYKSLRPSLFISVRPFGFIPYTTFCTRDRSYKTPRFNLKIQLISSACSYEKKFVSLCWGLWFASQSCKKMIHIGSTASVGTRNGLSTIMVNTWDHELKKIKQLKALWSSIPIKKWWCSLLRGISKESVFFQLLPDKMTINSEVNLTNWMIH